MDTSWTMTVSCVSANVGAAARRQIQTPTSGPGIRFPAVDVDAEGRPGAGCFRSMGFLFLMGGGCRRRGQWNGRNSEYWHRKGRRCIRRHVWEEILVFAGLVC